MGKSRGRKTKLTWGKDR